MDHVIRSCDYILQNRNVTSILSQVIVVAMVMYYCSILLGGVPARIIILYGSYTYQWNISCY